jgi:hypothetical protein
LGTFQLIKKASFRRGYKSLNMGGKFGAGDRGRTGDVQLGKLAFYR